MLSIFSKIKNKISDIITINRRHTRLRYYQIGGVEIADKHANAQEDSNTMTNEVRFTGFPLLDVTCEKVDEDDPHNTNSQPQSPLYPSPPPPSPVITRCLFNTEIDETLIKEDYELQNLLNIMSYHKFDISNVILEKRFETMVNNIKDATDIFKIKIKLLYIIIANNTYRDLFEEKKYYRSIKINQYIGVFRYNDYIIRIDDCPYSFMNEANMVERMSAIKEQTSQIIQPFLIYTNTRYNTTDNFICECRKPNCNCIYTDKAEEEYAEKNGEICDDLAYSCFNKLRENTISFSLQYYVKESVSLYTWIKDHMAMNIYNCFSSIQRTFYLHLFYQCTMLLRHIHSVSIVHGDIKPDNILICEHPSFNINHPERCKKFTVYLIDFGLSGIHKSGVGTGGTIPYCHPEFKNITDTNRSSKYNWKKLDTKHDIWSLGLSFLTLYIYRDFYNYYHKYPNYFFLKNGYVSSLIIDVITDPKIHDLFTKVMTDECISSNELCALLENILVS
jgi:serine/threonine protein kinase